jgi:flagellar protein FliO/FliZ
MCKYNCTGLLFFAGVTVPVISAAQTNVPGVRTVSAVDMLGWASGLLIVLVVFFACVWLVKKIGRIPGMGSAKMYVLGGLSLGTREKVVLLQVGKKQLLLGVAPGRIETLHVLEGDDCLVDERVTASATSSGKQFAQQLRQVLKGGTHG